MSIDEGKLKACPFCGACAVMHRAYFADGSIKYWTVKCDGCHVTGVHRVSKSEAIEAWNGRVESDEEKNLLKGNHRIGDELLKADEQIIALKKRFSCEHGVLFTNDTKDDCPECAKSDKKLHRAIKENRRTDAQEGEKSCDTCSLYHHDGCPNPLCGEENGYKDYQGKPTPPHKQRMGRSCQ